MESERETPIQYINAYIYIEREREIRKMVMMILHARQQKRHRCKKRLLDYMREGKGGMV